MMVIVWSKKNPYHKEIVQICRRFHLQQLFGLILLENNNRVVDADVQRLLDPLALLSCCFPTHRVRTLPHQGDGRSSLVRDRPFEGDGFSVEFRLVCVFSAISQGDLNHRPTTPFLHKVLYAGVALCLFALRKESKDKTQQNCTFPTAIGTRHKIHILVWRPETWS